MLKKAGVVAILALAALAVFAQNKKSAAPDTSAPTKVTGKATKTADG